LAEITCKVGAGIFCLFSEVCGKSGKKRLDEESGVRGIGTKGARRQGIGNRE
jgi:hypothetical protein